MMTEKKTIEELFPVENGLLSTIGVKYSLNFAEAYQLSLMDEEYVNSYSGLKHVSRIVEKNTVDDVVNIDKLSSIVGNRFVQKWNAMWKGLTVEYDILENYNMKEEEKIDRDIDDTLTSTANEVVSHTVIDEETKNEAVEGSVKNKNTQTDNTTITDTENDTRTMSDTTTENGTVQTSGTASTTSSATNGIFGFDASSAADADNNRGSSSSQSSDNTTDNRTITEALEDETNRDLTTQRNGSIVDDGETTTEETKTTSGSLERTENGENEKTENSNKKTIDNIVRTLTRAGNIGTTSSAQLQEQYLKIVEAWYDFCRIIYDDIDSILTIYII